MNVDLSVVSRIQTQLLHRLQLRELLPLPGKFSFLNQMLRQRAELPSAVEPLFC